MAWRSSWMMVRMREPKLTDPKEGPTACLKDLTVVPWVLVSPGGAKYHWAMVPEMVKTRISNTRNTLHSRVTLVRVTKGATQESVCQTQQSTGAPSASRHCPVIFVSR